jgi:hypothetical protein
MAVIPQRIMPVEDTIASIVPQCDILNIYLNSFQIPTPRCFNNPKIKVYRSENEVGDIGDVGKFYRHDTWRDCYVFTIDDKYIYPPDYVWVMTDCIEKYNRRAVISCHGRMIKPKCRSYYLDPGEMFSLLADVKKDIFVHELGTGCMAFHSDTFKVDFEMFPYTNMSDILLSMEMQNKNIPLLVMGHSRKWIKLSPKADQQYSIHSFFNQCDQLQTELVNGFDWKIRTC